jgi:phosphohistidine phosphatase
MRHGEAEKVDAKTEIDVQRQLTPEGRKQTQNVASKYYSELSGIDQLWASPYVRTQQTAEIIANNINKPVITADWLTPNSSVSVVMKQLSLWHSQTLLLVSHQPLVSDLVSSLSDSVSRHFRMEPASIVCVETDTFTGTIKWLYQSS